VAISPEPVRSVHPTVVRFEGFELDLESGVLSRNGERNRLQGQPLQLLELFLQRPGHLFTREQIQQHLWPDGTVVEFEHSVNAAVKRLREALNDDAEKPTFIETIPRRGYRFIARVEDSVLPAGAIGVPFLKRTHARYKQRYFAAGAVALLVIAAALVALRVVLARAVLNGTDVISWIT
jgi:DNA-binding winged helix-turn-helix (wHTH) protein